MPRTDEDEEIGEPGDDQDAAPAAGSGNEVKLKPWTQRRRKTLGQATAGRPAPLIDQVHALMHLWREGDVVKVDAYLKAASVRQNSLFAPLLQALVELVLGAYPILMPRPARRLRSGASVDACRPHVKRGS